MTEIPTKKLELPNESSSPSKRNDSLSVLDDVFSPIPSPNLNSDSSNSFLSRSPKLTLFEKAELFRKENKNLWEKQCDEMEKRKQDFNEIIPRSSFLDQYYEELDKSLIENEKIKEKEKLEPPKLVVKYIFNLPCDGDDEKQKETLSRNVCVFDKDEHFFDKFRSEKHEARGSKSEFIITVKKGKHLFNGLQKSSEKSTYSSLKYSLFDSHGRRKHKHKTEFIYVSRKGKARWSYNFILRGFSQEELKNYYIVLKVTAKTGDNSVVLVMVLKNRKGSVGKSFVTSSYAVSLCKPHLKSDWDDTIESPGKEFHALLNLSRKDRERESLAEDKEEHSQHDVQSQIHATPSECPTDNNSSASPEEINLSSEIASGKAKNIDVEEDASAKAADDARESSVVTTGPTESEVNEKSGKKGCVKSEKSCGAELEKSGGAKRFFSQLKFGKREKNIDDAAEDISENPPSVNVDLAPNATNEHLKHELSNPEPNDKNEQTGDSMPVNKTMPVTSKRSLFHLNKEKVKVNCDEINKLPPSSKMKVTPSKNINLHQEVEEGAEITGDGREVESLKPVEKKSFFSLKSSPLMPKKEKVKVTSDEKNRLPPSSKMKVTSTNLNQSVSSEISSGNKLQCNKQEESCVQ